MTTAAFVSQSVYNCLIKLICSDRLTCSTLQTSSGLSRWCWDMRTVGKYTCSAQIPTTLSPNSSLTGVTQITASTASPFLGLRCHRHGDCAGDPTLLKAIPGYATLHLFQKQPSPSPGMAKTPSLVHINGKQTIHHCFVVSERQDKSILNKKCLLSMYTQSIPVKGLFFPCTKLECEINGQVEAIPRQTPHKIITQSVEQFYILYGLLISEWALLWPQQIMKVEFGKFSWTTTQTQYTQSGIFQFFSHFHVCIRFTPSLEGCSDVALVGCYLMSVLFICSEKPLIMTKSIFYWF